MNNNRRINSISLMRELQPFVQGNILSAASAKEMITEYQMGEEKKIRDFINNPEMPLMYETCIQNVRKIIMN